MQIKSSQQSYRTRAGKLLTLEKLLTFLLLQIIIIATAIFIYNNYQTWQQNLTNNFLIKKNKIIAKQYNPDQFVIDLPYESQAKLAALKKKAIAEGIYSPPENPWVKGKLRYQGKSYSIKSALKGSFADHWINPKRISLKIKLKGNKRIKGMKAFSLVLPETRTYDAEWIYLQFANKLGLITPRTDFVNVTINGQDKGVYFLEENFSTAMLEYNKRRAGPIVHFDKSLYIQETARAIKNHNPNQPFDTSADNYEKNDTASRQSGDFQSREVEFVNAKTQDLLLEESAYQELFYEARDKLEQLRQGQIPLAKVFDLKLFSKLLAIKSLLQANEFDPNDEKFYYNPVTRLFEPIASELNGELVDGDNSGIWWTNLFKKLDFNQLQDFNALFFDNLDFWQSFYQSLQEISAEGFLVDFISKITAQRKRNQTLLRQTYPKIKFGGLSGIITRNKNIIQELLNPLQQVRGYLVCPADQEQAWLSLTNLTLMPLIVSELSLGQQVISSTEQLLNRKKKDSPLESKDFLVQLTVPCSEVITSTAALSIKSSLVGKAPQISTVIEKRKSGFSYQPSLDEYPTLDQLDFVQRSGTNLVIPQGNWKIQAIYQVPTNFQLIIRAGATINLSNQGAIISASPVELRGKANQRILIKSSDGSGGLFVVARTNLKSVVENVDFDNLNIPKKLANRFTGSITFYESPVEISNTTITNANSEDALNIVRSKFKINQIYLENSFSDAIDIDYSDGRIVKPTFEKIGNDALDFSTSKVTVLNTKANNIHEKAISCGENSQILIVGATLTNAAIGIASKDLSKATAIRVRMKNINSGFVALRKKPEYGFATITAHQIALKNVDQKCVRDSEKSVISLNEVNQCPIDKTLRSQLYAK